MKSLHLVLFIVVLVFSQCSTDRPVNGSLSIIPFPVSLTKAQGEFVVTSTTSIVVKDSVATQSAHYLAELISSASKFDAIVTSEFRDEDVIEFNVDSELNEEAYSLTITPKKIAINASTPSGFFYAVQTLRQIFGAPIESNNKSVAAWSLPAVQIADRPTYQWRGMHLDVSRHFFSVAYLKKFIDRMALYKLNKFHLHLTDDQGWRIEIKKYPELTSAGAFRVFNNQDSVCIEQATENPDFALPTEFIQDTPTGKTYGGFYTQDQIRELVRYASERQVTIVPEIDMPGHMNAALNSYPELSCVDGSGWGKLFSIPLCPCEEGTYQFTENVLTEIAELFPGEYVHIGGDEVDRSTWAQSAACKALMKKEGMTSVAQLQGYFVRRLERFLQSKNKTMIGWDEVLEGGVDSTTHIMYWRGWVPDAPIEAVRGNHQVIMSPTSCCYYDYAPDRTTLEKMYNFNPIPTEITHDESKQITGIQANIWTEWIPTESRLEFMVLPRMLALAEVAWARPTSFELFERRLDDHYSRLDALGIAYRLPDLPNLKEHVVFLDQATFSLEKPTAVQEIRYTTDGSAPNKNSTLYTAPVAVDSTTTFKLLTLGAGQRAGNTYTVRYEKQTFLKASTSTFSAIKCVYYEGDSWKSVKDTVNAKRVRAEQVEKIDIPTFCREESYALVFSTYVDVPTDGVYTFYLASDDGSVLTVGDRMVIDHDGFQGSQEVSGQVALSKGAHLLRLSYFEAGGGNSVSLSMEGPSLKKRKL